MSKPLRFASVADAAAEYVVWTTKEHRIGTMVRDPQNDARWFFYASGAVRPVTFRAKDTSTAFAFLENLSRAFSA